MNFLKRKEYIYKYSLSFSSLLKASLLLEISEGIISILNIQFSVKLLLPVVLYALYMKLSKRSVRLYNNWYLLLPFAIFLIFYITSIFYPVKFRWTEWYNITFVLFAASIVTLLFIDLPQISASINVKKYLLVQQLNLLMLMLIGLVCIQLFFNVSKIPVTAENTYLIHSRKGILWIILIASIFLKINYFIYRRNNKQDLGYIYPTDRQLEDYTEKLKYLFKNKEIYLKQDLNMDILSVKSGISKSDLSYFFNQYLEKDFLRFVAEYRIAYALELIHKKGDFYTLKAIANESGFKSTNTFNKYFQMIIGETPSAYLNKKKVE